MKVNNDLSNRLTKFAPRIIKLFSALPKSTEAQVIGKQFLRSGTSIGAHYREGLRGRSSNEFVAKIGALQELDETYYWIDLLEKAGIVSADRLGDLIIELNQLIAVLTTISKKSKSNVT